MVPLLGVPDVNAIAAKFFVAKKKSKTVQFQAKGRVELYLELQHKTYLEIVAHLEGDDSEPDLGEQVAKHSVCHKMLASYSDTDILLA
jgi:hypothetical protein